MLVHERFVFLHVPKTGGTFVSKSLDRELRPPGGMGSAATQHAGWSAIPESARGLPVLAYVRNPWDWYVSWYSFKLAHPRSRDRVFNALSADGEIDFAGTVRNACELVRPITGGRDFYTSVVLATLGTGLESDRLTVGRFESLVDDLATFLARAGVQLDDAAMTRIRDGAPLNATERRPYREYYADELRELVGDSCRMLIDRFDYRF